MVKNCNMEVKGKKIEKYNPKRGNSRKKKRAKSGEKFNNEWMENRQKQAKN